MVTVEGVEETSPVTVAARTSAVTSAAEVSRPGKVARVEYFHDGNAPSANSMSPTAFAVTVDQRGWVLLVRRVDCGNWELPGGKIELGESADAAAVREVAEEAGMVISIDRLAGVYSDPGHVMVYPDTGEVRQQLAVCFHATPLHGVPRPDGEETSAAAWVDPRDLASLPIHPSIRPRIEHALIAPFDPHFG